MEEDLDATKQVDELCKVLRKDEVKFPLTRQVCLRDKLSSF